MARILTRRNFLKLTSVVTGTFAAGCMGRFAADAAIDKKPNILFILADDLGWMDVNIYGSKYYQTPNIDRLAGKGMMFTNAYSASPLCSPTRASLLTGKYPSREGLNFTQPEGHLPPRDKNEPLMPSKAPAYRKMITPLSSRYVKHDEYTYANAFKDAGYKTGIIGKWHLGLNPEHWPANYGFDFDMGAPVPGPSSHFAPYNMENFPEGKPGKYVSETVTEQAVKFIEQYKHVPFMLSVWHFSVHAPFQAKEELTEKYRNKFDPRSRQDCAVMASMIESMDQSVGQLLDKLEELGLDDNTIVIFMSDNGGNMYDVVEGSTPTNNAPLRGGKGNIYEGGTRCPCIVAWPGVTKPASKSEGIISTIDFYPTMLDMAGIKPNPVQLIDGVSFTGLLRGRKDLDRQAIFWHFPRYVQATQNLPASSVRKGDYKLIRFYGEGPDRSNAFELYDLKNDIGEKKNLAEKYPQKVKELDRLIDGFIEDTGSLVPGKNPEYIPFKKGWSCSKDCSTTVRDGILTLQSKGNDPYIYTYDTPCVSGRMQVKFKMRSSIKGPAAIFYTGNGGSGKGDNFPIDNSVNFEVESNRKWKEYTVVLNVRGELGGLRIDPGGSIGAAEIAWIELSRLYGPVLKKWNF